MRRNALRTTRVVVSVVIFIMVTLLWVAYSGIFLYPLGWVSKIQVFPTAMWLSITMFVFWEVVALIFGRVYCSSVCPLGTWLDGVARAGRRARGSKGVYRYSEAFDLRSFFCLVFLTCAAAGISIIPVIVEPYSMYSRWVVELFKPVWGAINNTLAYFGAVTGWWDVYYVGHVRASLFAVVLALATMIAVSIPSWFYGRTYCNTVCPVGTLLGFVSARSLFHIDIDTDSCTNCRRCEYVCKSSCINLNDHVVDGSRCVNCFNLSLIHI